MKSFLEIVELFRQSGYNISVYKDNGYATFSGKNVIGRIYTTGDIVCSNIDQFESWESCKIVEINTRNFLDIFRTISNIGST
jgi:hypothetical protein